MASIRTTTALLAALLAASPAAGGDRTSGSNDAVKFSVSVKEPRMRAGGASTLIFRLSPKKGYHVNVRPQPEIRFDSSGMVASSGKPDFASASKQEYLDVSKPIKVAFTLSRKAAPGPSSIKGVFTYFYCSDAEGWCSKFRQPFDLNVTVRE